MAISETSTKHNFGPSESADLMEKTHELPEGKAESPNSIPTKDSASPLLTEYLSASDNERFQNRENFGTAALKMFGTLDSDGDGFLNETEISKGIQNDSFTKQEQNYAKLLSWGASSLRPLSNDEWGTETKGVTRNDLTEFLAQSRTEREDLQKVKEARDLLLGRDNSNRWSGDIAGTALKYMSENRAYTPGQRESLKWLSESKKFFEVDAAAGIASALLTGGWLTQENLQKIGRDPKFKMIDGMKFE